MFEKILNAITDLSNRFANAQKKLSDILDAKCVRNAEAIEQTSESIAETQDALCEQSTTTEQSVSDIENAMCESELSNDERLAAIEDALCELSMQ